MKIHNADFIKGAVDPEGFPVYKYPEVAFSGRSNVGKSTLINSIVHRKNLAKISSTPGKTKEINFFVVEDKWSFADMPGFGYTATGRKDRERWRDLNFNYFESRENLKLVCALIDSRHDPMRNDLELIEWLEMNYKPYVVILTKCDKISKKLTGERKEQIDQLLKMCNFAVDVLPYSAVSGIGRKELMGIIRRMCELGE